MRYLAIAVCILFTAPTFAQDKSAAPATKADAKKAPSDKQKAQQARMTDCNAKAKDMKGDDRKKFMSSCLKGETEGVSAKQQAQRDKMASCNKTASAKAMKGNDRKKFMSDCLKG